ncbi:MAG: hypothetical protein NTW59_04255 [Candidatus Diapherotrites archaeon]|nr:hypothetical protein [Candidatus Diapherotrites archaeon]
MGIYKQGKLQLPDFKFSFAKAKKPALAVAGAAVVILVALGLMALLQPAPIQGTLDPNPLDLTKGAQNSFLTVTVTNVTDATATNVPIRVEAVAADALVVFPKGANIATLGKGEYRTLNNAFSVRPNPNAVVYSGAYDIVITATINGQQFSKKVTLELKAA